MTITLTCPHCRNVFATEQADAPAWPCPHCGQSIAAAEGAAAPSRCRVCGSHELYVQKDFPHWLGMGVLVVALAISCFTYAMHWIMVTWIVLIGSAALDGALYLAMGNVVICYRCLAQYRGFAIPPALASFDLKIGEKYRQERLRKEELEREQRRG
jgi:hypothetical protein